MRILLFDLLPQLLNGVVVRRIRRQLEDLQPCRLLGKEGLGLGARVILCPILNQNNVLRGLREHPREKGNIGSRVEAAFLPLIKEAPGEVLNQAKDLVAFPLARGFDLGLLAAPRPRLREGAPLREAGFIAKQQQGVFGARHA